jgi:hypothetical protein
LGDGGLG